MLRAGGAYRIGPTSPANRTTQRLAGCVPAAINHYGPVRYETQWVDGAHTGEASDGALDLCTRRGLPTKRSPALPMTARHMVPVCYFTVSYRWSVSKSLAEKYEGGGVPPCPWCLEPLRMMQVGVSPGEVI